MLLLSLRQMFWKKFLFYVCISTILLNNGAVLIPKFHQKSYTLQ